MSILDIWINLQSEINFFNKRNFDNIPSVPGVYAWFYPLQVRTYIQKEFFEDIANVFDYDAGVEDISCKKAVSVTLSWREILMNVWLRSKDPNHEQFKKEWENACQNKLSFNALRNIFYKSSIFMPPLYVGKTDDLHRRCHEHLYAKSDANSFSTRFIAHAQKKNFLAAKKVSDLLLICIQTRQEHDFSGDFEGLIEMFLKNLAKPVYSKK